MSCAHLICKATIVVLALALAGCSAFLGTPPEPAPVVKQPPQPTAAPPVPTPQPPARPPQPSTSGAWQPLVDKAAQASARGDYEQALALLERAQRIDPESGEIYLQMARTHRAKGDAAQARATAERGMLFCNGSAQCNALRALTR
jgi:tetratricopeptide (TPR) repeat protein